jgi:hypothetical protein
MIEVPTQKINDILISDTYKIVFFNVKKAASSSITNYFFDHLNGRRYSPCKHNEIHWYKDYQDYFSFAFVRNPFDRLLSCYKNKIRQPDIFDITQKGIDKTFLPYGSKFFKEMTFKQFLEAVISLHSEDYDRHFGPQYPFVCDKYENVIVDFIGRVENFKIDFSFLIEEQNLPQVDLNYYWHNKTTVEAFHDEETIELAKQVYGVEKDMYFFYNNQDDFSF